MKLKKEYEENGLLLVEDVVSQEIIDKINLKIELFKKKNSRFLNENNLFKIKSSIG